MPLISLTSVPDKILFPLWNLMSSVSNVSVSLSIPFSLVFHALPQPTMAYKAVFIAFNDFSSPKFQNPRSSCKQFWMPKNYMEGFITAMKSLLGTDFCLSFLSCFYNKMSLLNLLKKEGSDLNHNPIVQTITGENQGSRNLKQLVTFQPQSGAKR